MWLRVEITSIRWSPVVTVLKFFLKMLLIALKDHIMFRLKAHVVFAVASYSKINPLFEMCIAFYVLLVSKERKYQ